MALFIILYCQDTHSFTNANDFLLHARCNLYILIFHFSYLVHVCVSVGVCENFFDPFVECHVIYNILAIIIYSTKIFFIKRLNKNYN